MRDVADRILDGDARARTPDGRRRRPATTLLLIDGNSLTYRAFFALPTDMTTASGQVTNAVFGFTSMLINLLQRPPARRRRGGLRPARADVPPRGRSPTYKANRDAAPDILRQQMGLVRQVVEALRHHRSSSCPAARPTTSSPPSPTRPATPGDDVIIVTGDRDSYQLVEDPHVKVLYNQRGVSATTRSTTRPASRSAPASRPAQYVAVRRAARRPAATTCPACPASARRPRPS